MRASQETGHLTATEQRLLDVLSLQAGLWTMRADLVRRVWGPEYLETSDSGAHLLRVNIARLRHKLAGQPLRVETRPGFGYRVVRGAGANG